VGGILGGVVFIVLILIGYIILLNCNKENVEYSAFPKDVRYFWEHYLNNSHDWKCVEIGKTMYYKYKIKKQNEDWVKFQNLFDSLGGNDVEIEFKDVYAIFNKTLIESGYNFRKTTETRIMESPQIFNKTTWKEDANDRRNWTIELYNKRLKNWDWNKDLQLPILPTLHGTDAKHVWNISATGFANISTLDAGYYGKGIYFTTYLLYTLPYLTRLQPALIISYCTPGNVWPVIEHPNEDNPNELGAPLKSGYNSHYIIASKNGYPHKERVTKDVFDELVISQEVQAIPAFVILIKSLNLKQQMKYAVYTERQLCDNYKQDIEKHQEEITNPKTNRRNDNDNVQVQEIFDE